jgi:peptide/nickel transport system permease protein
MHKYIGKSLLQIIPVLLILSVIVFLLLRVAGNPLDLMLPENATVEDRAVLSSALGLDQPMVVQYWKFLKGALVGNFGQSYRYNNEDALPIVLERLPKSLQLAGYTLAFTIIWGISLGIFSALKRNKAIDLVIRGISVFGKTVPNFWLGIMLIIIFSVKLKWLPPSGSGSLRYMVLPTITLGLGYATRVTTLVRANLLDVLGQDYIRTARSKGLGEATIIIKHGLKNSMLPVVTTLAMDLARILGGSMIVETIFAYPGMGQLIMKAVTNKDMAIVQAGVFVIAIIMILCNLVADVLYALLDPRIKY